MVSQNCPSPAFLFDGLENQTVGSLQSAAIDSNLFRTQAGRQGRLLQQRRNAISQRILRQVGLSRFPRFRGRLSVLRFSSVVARMCVVMPSVVVYHTPKLVSIVIIVVHVINNLFPPIPRFCKLWDTETGECISRFSSRKVPYCVKFNPDEDKQHLFVCGTSDKKILCWDTRSGEIVQEYDRHLGRFFLSCLSVSSLLLLPI